jgi:hypothetical protein
VGIQLSHNLGDLRVAGLQWVATGHSATALRAMVPLPGR